jgi:hypothetical protein
MPTVRKLSSEEIQAQQDKGKGRHQLTSECYDRAIADFAPGNYGELLPDPGEKRLTANLRLKQAAQRRGFTIRFLRSSGEALLFKVGEGETQPAAAPAAITPPEPVKVEAPPAPKRRGGRPKKQSA